MKPGNSSAGQKSHARVLTSLEPKVVADVPLQTTRQGGALHSFTRKYGSQGLIFVFFHGMHLILTSSSLGPGGPGVGPGNFRVSLGKIRGGPGGPGKTLLLILLSLLLPSFLSMSIKYNHFFKGIGFYLDHLDQPYKTRQICNELPGPTWTSTWTTWTSKLSCCHHLEVLYTQSKVMFSPVVSVFSACHSGEV